MPGDRGEKEKRSAPLMRLNKRGLPMGDAGELDRMS